MDETPSQIIQLPLHNRRYFSETFITFTTQSVDTPSVPENANNLFFPITTLMGPTEGRPGAEGCSILD